MTIDWATTSSRPVAALARLARWILMVRDRVDNDEVPMTHEFLGLMLGVRRAGVTVALAELEGEGAIRSVRGGVLVKDRARLEAIAGSCYRRPDCLECESGRSVNSRLAQ